MSDVLKRLLCLVLALVVVFSFSACRHSPVLEQTVYTADGEVDPNNQQTDNDEDHSEEDTTLPPRTTKPSQKQQADQTRVSGKEPRSDPQTRQNTNTNGQPSQNPSQAPKNSQSNTNKGSGEVPGVSEDPTSPAKAVDRNSVNRTDLPEDVATVAAVGDAALYVEMLGGSNRLVASSASFTTSYYAQLFSDYSNVIGLWEKSGESAMTDAQFQQLLTKDPEAVFYIAYKDVDGYSVFQTFTENQLSQLNQRGIYTIPLALFNTTANIKNNVKVIGKVLGKGSKVPGAKNANNVADDYIRWMDSIIGGKEGQTYSGPNQLNLDQDGVLSEKNSHYSEVGQHTLYISGWDDTVSVDPGGPGVAYARTGYSWRSSPLSYYLSLAGAANNAVLVPDGGFNRDLPVVPFINATVSGYVNGGSIGTDYQDKSRFMTSYGGYIGTDSFKTILVDSAATKQAMERSEAWIPYENQPYGVDGQRGWGRPNGDGMDFSNIHGKYGIIVNPYGVGSWTEGSPESPLEVLWAEQIFLNGQDADAAFNNIAHEVNDFYQTFYGFSLSAQDLESIKNGL